MSGLDPSQMSDADKKFKDVQDIGKASFNSLESTLNYGSGLGQYGWKSINAVETILHKYKLEKKQTIFNEESILKELKDLEISLKKPNGKSQNTDLEKLTSLAKILSDPQKQDEIYWQETLKNHYKDILKKTEDQNQNDIVNSNISKINSFYKKLGQQLDSDVEQKKRELATKFYSHPLIDKLSPTVQSLDAAIAFLGGPAAFIGHILGATVKNFSARVLPDLAQDACNISSPKAQQGLVRSGISLVNKQNKIESSLDNR